jgi:DNA-binding MarR family transcriptional regulator
MKLAVGTESATDVNWLALSMVVESACKAHVAPSTIHTDVSSIVSAGWNVKPVAVFAVMVLGGWPRPVSAIIVDPTEVLIHKGPLPVNTIGPIVDLTPGSISIAVDRLFEKGLVSRVESAEDRRVRIVALTSRGSDLIVPAFRNHSGQMRRVFSELSREELRGLEVALRKLVSAQPR